MESFDQGLWNWFQAHRTVWLDPLVKAVGWLGTASVLAVVVLGTALFLLAKRRPLSAATVAAAFGLSVLLAGPLQTLIGRERPEVTYQPLVVPEAPYSFPSTHAWLAAATYLAVAFAIADVRPGARVLAITGAVLLTLVVGVSRLFVGLCYPSDVVAGWLAGFFVAAVLRNVLRR